MSPSDRIAAKGGLDEAAGTRRETASICPDRKADNRRRFVITVTLVAVGVAVLALSPGVRNRAHGMLMRLRGRLTVEQRLALLDPGVRERLAVRCAAVGIAYPPTGVVLLGLKQERRLEVYARSGQGPHQLLLQHPVIAASGSLGPKLREGDRQVPEGIYRVVSLNPNSRFHLSVEIDYPNEFDRRVAAQEGRERLGGDIFIHGGSASIGCLAIGDPAIEEVFTLLADVGIGEAEVLISPLDLRVHPLPDGLGGGWRDELYESLRRRLDELPRP